MVCDKRDILSSLSHPKYDLLAWCHVRIGGQKQVRVRSGQNRIIQEIGQYREKGCWLRYGGARGRLRSMRDCVVAIITNPAPTIRQLLPVVNIHFHQHYLQREIREIGGDQSAEMMTLSDHSIDPTLMQTSSCVTALASLFTQVPPPPHTHTFLPSFPPSSLVIATS